MRQKAIEEFLSQILCKLDKLEKNAGVQLMTPDQAADLLGVKKQTLAVWRTRSEGPSYTKVGTSCRYQLDDLRDFINSNKIRIGR